MAQTKNYKLIKDTRDEWTGSGYFKRMDDDRKLAILDPYEMKNIDGQKTPDVINVTMNEAEVFLGRAKSIMNGANMQRIVFGRGLSDKDTTTIEQFYHDIYYANDLMVANAFNTSLYGFLIEQILIRGSITARVLMREDGDKFLPDISPFDTRYFVGESDSQGLVWGAPRVVQSKTQIERDYGIVLHGNNRAATIDDFWDDEVNEIYIADQRYLGGTQSGIIDSASYPERELKHGLGYPPLIYMQSGAGLPSLMDADGLKYKGESIFSSNRGLIPELHRAASIFQTLTAMSFEGSYEYASDEGTEATPPKNFGVRRKQIPVDIGGGYKLIPINDVKNATRLFYNMLVGALQRGGLPNIDYGNLSFPLSAVAISKLTASKDAIFIPRLNALSLFFRAASQMIKKQYIQGGYKVELGEEGLEREYSTRDIDKKFGTKYAFHSASPEQNIANTAIGQQQKALGLSTHTIFTETLKLNDPEGEINKGRDEKAEAGDIAITLKRRLWGMADKDGKFDEHAGKDIDAEMILQQLEMVLRDRAGGGVMGLQPPSGGIGAEQSVKPMVDVFGGGGGGSPPPEEETMPEPDEAENREDRRQSVVRRSKSEA